jgi:hypothetical protein
MANRQPESKHSRLLRARLGVVKGRQQRLFMLQDREKTGNLAERRIAPGLQFD